MGITTEPRQAPAPITTQRDAIMSLLEDLWSQLDAVFGPLSPTEWAAKHGRDWTFADVPFHLAYFDRDMIAGAILRGPDLPAAEQVLIKGRAQVDAWNAPYFAGGPGRRSVAESLTQMRASRDLLRRLAAGRDDRDLQRPVFVGLVGRVTVAEALRLCHMHSYQHYTELRARLKRNIPALTPAHDRLAMGTLMASFSAALDDVAARALARPFTVVMSFTGPGGGDWTLRVVDGKLAISEGAASSADLVMTQAPLTMAKTALGLQNPLLALLTGKTRVRGFRALGTFGKLFPPPGKAPRR